MIIITNTAQMSKPRDFTQGINRYAKFIIKEERLP